MDGGMSPEVVTPAFPVMQSPTLGKIAEALANAMAEFKTPKKTKVAKVRSEKGNYEYRYSDLADMMDCVRGPLSKNGIFPFQQLAPTPRGMLLTTRLVHKSGEWIASEYPMPTFAKPQEFGSALTYARRYSLSALLGIAADEDDDGETAQNSEQPREKAAPRKAAPQPAPDEPDATADARARYGKILDRIKVAPREDIVDQVLDDARDDIAFIKKHAGEQHLQRLYDKAAERKARIADIPAHP